jgi:hypothetical protein
MGATACLSTEKQCRAVVACSIEGASKRKSQKRENRISGIKPGAKMTFYEL